MDFFDMYFGTNGQHQLCKFYEQRGELGIKPGEWTVIDNDEDRKDMHGVDIPNAC